MYLIYTDRGHIEFNRIARFEFARLFSTTVYKWDFRYSYHNIVGASYCSFEFGYGSLCQHQFLWVYLVAAILDRPPNVTDRGRRAD